MSASVNSSSCSILVVLEEQDTLYMRPAAMLAKIANKFESDVILEHGKARANGKSLLDIITLGVNTGADFKVLASGKDAPTAIQAIMDFFKRFFLDGEVTDSIVHEQKSSNKSISGNFKQKEEEDMKQKKQTVVKRQAAQVKEVSQDRKKMQNFVWPISGNVKEVSLAGDFNNWKPEPMAKRDSGFHAAVKLDPGVYQYKFVVDGEWHVDPTAKGNAQNGYGTTNSVLLVN